MSYYVYIIQSEKDGSYYVGSTQDIEARLALARSIGILVYNALDLFYKDPLQRKARTDHPGALHHIIVWEIARGKMI